MNATLKKSIPKPPNLDLLYGVDLIPINPGEKDEFTIRSPIVEKPVVVFPVRGQPTGVLEIASWASSQGVCDSTVFNMRPLDAGFVKPEDDRITFFDDTKDPYRRFRFAGRDCVGLFEGERCLTYDVSKLDRGELKEKLENYCIENKIGTRRFFDVRGNLRSETLMAAASLGPQLVKKLLNDRPDFIGFRSLAINRSEVRQQIRAARLFSDAQIVIGGPMPSTNPEAVLDDLGADYAFMGEAERTFTKFMSIVRKTKPQDISVDQSKALADLPGLVYRYGGRTYANRLPEDNYGRTSLDGFDLIDPGLRRQLREHNPPRVSEELIAINTRNLNLLEGFEDVTFRSMEVNSGRGCPGMCVFCSNIGGLLRRNKSAQQLIDEIRDNERYVKAHGITFKKFHVYLGVRDTALQENVSSLIDMYDEDFFLDRKRALEFFRIWGLDENRDLRERYRLTLQANPSSLFGGKNEPDGTYNQIMAYVDKFKPLIQFGTEAFEPAYLKRLGKRHTLTQVDRIQKDLEKAGVDYNFNTILSDFDMIPEEFIDHMRLLTKRAIVNPGMYISDAPSTVPTYHSPLGKKIRAQTYTDPEMAKRMGNFMDYEHQHRDLLDPLVDKMLNVVTREYEAFRQFGGMRNREAIYARAFVAMGAVIDSELKAAEKAGDSKKTSHLKELQIQVDWAKEDIRKGVTEYLAA